MSIDAIEIEHYRDKILSLQEIIDCLKTERNILEEKIEELRERETLQTIQKRIGEWSKNNFGEQISKVDDRKLGSLAPLLGVIEELGELSHCVLKRHQGIRGFDNLEQYLTKRNDAMADLLIYLCDFAEREGVDLFTILKETWDNIVSKRNWKAKNE